MGEIERKVSVVLGRWILFDLEEMGVCVLLMGMLLWEKGEEKGKKRGFCCCCLLLCCNEKMAESGC